VPCLKILTPRHTAVKTWCTRWAGMMPPAREGRPHREAGFKRMRGQLPGASGVKPAILAGTAGVRAAAPIAPRRPNVPAPGPAPLSGRERDPVPPTRLNSPTTSPYLGGKAGTRASLLLLLFRVLPMTRDRRHPARRSRGGGDRAAAQDGVTVVEDRRLSPGD